MEIFGMYMNGNANRLHRLDYSTLVHKSMALLFRVPLPGIKIGWIQGVSSPLISANLHQNIHILICATAAVHISSVVPCRRRTRRPPTVARSSK